MNNSDASFPQDRTVALTHPVRLWFRRRKVRLRFLWWSAQNYRQGYKWGPIQRFRCCDHTTPYHYQSCENRP